MYKTAIVGIGATPWFRRGESLPRTPRDALPRGVDAAWHALIHTLLATAGVPRAAETTAWLRSEQPRANPRVIRTRVGMVLLVNDDVLAVIAAAPALHV